MHAHVLTKYLCPSLFVVSLHLGLHGCRHTLTSSVYAWCHSPRGRAAPGRVPCQGNTWECLSKLEATSPPAKIPVTCKSPVGDISAVTLIRTDTTLDHSQKAEKVCYCSFSVWAHYISIHACLSNWSHFCKSMAALQNNSRGLHKISFLSWPPSGVRVSPDCTCTGSLLQWSFKLSFDNFWPNDRPRWQSLCCSTNELVHVTTCLDEMFAAVRRIGLATHSWLIDCELACKLAYHENADLQHLHMHAHTLIREIASSY